EYAQNHKGRDSCPTSRTSRWGPVLGFLRRRRSCSPKVETSASTASQAKERGSRSNCRSRRNWQSHRGRQWIKWRRLQGVRCDLLLRLCAPTCTQTEGVLVVGPPK